MQGLVDGHTLHIRHGRYPHTLGNSTDDSPVNQPMRRQVGKFSQLLRRFSLRIGWLNLRGFSGPK